MANMLDLIISQPSFSSQYPDRSLVEMINSLNIKELP